MLRWAIEKCMSNISSMETRVEDLRCAKVFEPVGPLSYFKLK